MLRSMILVIVFACAFGCSAAKSNISVDPHSRLDDHVASLSHELYNDEYVWDQGDLVATTDIMLMDGYEGHNKDGISNLFVINHTLYNHIRIKGQHFFCDARWEKYGSGPDSTNIPTTNTKACRIAHYVAGYKKSAVSKDCNHPHLTDAGWIATHEIVSLNKDVREISQFHNATGHKFAHVTSASGENHYFCQVYWSSNIRETMCTVARRFHGKDTLAIQEDLQQVGLR